jgi:hypothetical protein
MDLIGPSRTESMGRKKYEHHGDYLWLFKIHMGHSIRKRYEAFLLSKSPIQEIEKMRRDNISEEFKVTMTKNLRILVLQIYVKRAALSKSS